MANTDDLRYKRTETAIRTAFITLVAEQPVSSVTASAVCRRAQISRNAFYLHHGSITALYAALVEELVNDVRTKAWRRLTNVRKQALTTTSRPQSLEPWLNTRIY